MNSLHCCVVTAKVKNFSEFSSASYLLNSWTLCSHLQWGAEDAEIRVPSVENMELELRKVFPLKLGVGQDIATLLRILPGISPLLISTLPVHSLAFFSKTSPEFFLC